MPEGELPVGRLLDIARALGTARDKGIGHRVPGLRATTRQRPLFHPRVCEADSAAILKPSSVPARLSLPQRAGPKLRPGLSVRVASWAGFRAIVQQRFGGTPGPPSRQGTALKYS